MPRRRDMLKTMGAAATLALAGCPSSESDANNDTEAPSSTPVEESPGDGGDGAEETETEEESGDGTVSAADVAVASELNVYRTRLFDAVALGHAGASGAGATVASTIFARFENASGENNAHERLEAASTEAYEGFESALGELRSELEADDVPAAQDAATTGADHVRTALVELVGEANVNPLDVLFYGTRAATAGALAGEDRSNVAADVAQETLAAFEQAAVHDPLEGASGEAYEAFEGNLEAIVNASGPDAAAEAARASLDGAIEGAYAFGPEPLAGAGHISAYQARGWDAAAATHLGGPGTDYGHAAALNIYRARAYDAHWVATRGETDTAATMAGDIFAHFEGARAHEALEEASGEAYEGFEGGLSDLRSAIENGNSEGIGSAVERVDSNLVTGIEALAGGNAPLLQAGFFKARFADARELYRQDKNGQAAAITHGLFQRFEANELDFHETLEETSDQLYQTFEEEHLSALVTAYENDDESSVETHHQGVQDALLQFEAEYSAALASGAEATYMAALGFDAAGVDTLGNSSRAAAIAQSAFQHFEQGAAGYHEALEEADSELYESFEAALGAIRSAAENGSAVYPESKTFNEEAVASAYAIAEAGGSGSGAAAVVGDVFASFEQARVHEMLEEADTAAYEGFEAALTDYQSALESGDASTAGTFADAARTAQFAVAGSVDAAPSGSGGGSGEETEESEPSLEGGPNVVEDVPDDADHVVEMQAVAFNPAELTVSAGDTVAFEHVGGEAHNVVAYQDEIPENAEYWASGGFDSEEAARQGWENGQGAVQSGQSYVHTFETTGEHNYFCVPHEAAGMVGTIVVE